MAVTRRFSRLWAPALLAWLTSASTTVYAAGGYIDNFGFDPYATCRRAAPIDPGAIKTDREAAVFAVWVMRDGGLQPNGTATLVDDTGIFVTAAHVVHSYKDR